MKNENYKISIDVHGDTKTAFENICSVAGWWTSNMEGSTNKLNDVFTVHFGDTFVTFQITGFNFYAKIVWSVTDSKLPWLNDKKEWNNTRIIWEISEENNSTKITMTHAGLIPAVECYENCEKGWNFYVGQSLLKLINEGKGMPGMRKNASLQITQ